MSIRHATSDDLPAIVAIFNAAIPTGVTAETAAINIESRRAWFEEHSPATYPLWVEERDGERFIRIPDDLGYPVTEERLESVWRG